MLKLIKESFNHFFKNNPLKEGAALAYYSMFSLLPVTIIIISFLDIFFSKQAVAGEVYLLFNDLLGHKAALQIQNTIKDHHMHFNSILTSSIGFVSLALSASGMLNQMHSSFNSIWDVTMKEKSKILTYLSKHLTSFFLLISFIFFMLLSTCVNSFLVMHYSNLHVDYKFLVVLEHFISFVVASFIFTIMFTILSDAKVNLKPALIGGMITSLLFLLGKIGIGIYLSHSNTSSYFGSSSFIALFMLWIYYISQIIFLGASFVKIISDRLGCEIVPKK